MMAERISDSADSPAIWLVRHGRNCFGSGLDRPVEEGVGVLDNDHHADGAAAQRLGAEVQMLGRLIRQPELGPLYGEARHQGATIVLNTEHFIRAESGPVKLDRSISVSDREHGRNRGFHIRELVPAMANSKKLDGTMLAAVTQPVAFRENLKTG
jgi:hypothetical protein